MPCHNGHNTAEAIVAILAGKSKVFIGLGGNFAQVTPDSPRTHAALASCDLTVHIDTKLNRSHLTTGHNALILPCLGHIDTDRQAEDPQAVTVGDSLSMIRASYGQLEPLSQQMHLGPAIIVGIAKATLGSHPVDWGALIANHERIHGLIAGTTPGFTDFNRRVRHPGGLYLGSIVGERRWNTTSGRANFIANPLPRDLLPAQICDSGLGFDLILQTLRSHDQYNTTIYGLDDRYREMKGRRKVVLANEAGIHRLGYQPGDKVGLVLLWSDSIERRVHHFILLAFNIPIDQAAAYCPEINPLVPLKSVGVGSHTSTSEFIVVRLERVMGNGRIIRSPRKAPPPATGGGVLGEKSMKGLEGRPFVGAGMANILLAKIPISTLKSRLAFGLRPSPLKKVPHKRQTLGIFRVCSTNRRLTLISGLGQPQRRSRHPHREKLSMKCSLILLLSPSLVGGTVFAGNSTRAAIGGTSGGVLGLVAGDVAGGSTSAAVGSGIGGTVGGAVGVGCGNKTGAVIGGGLGIAGGNVIGRQIGGSTGGLIGAALGSAGGGTLGNHYGNGNCRYDDNDDYRDRRYYHRAGYRDGYYRRDNGHRYGRYKKWKHYKHHRRYYDDWFLRSP